MYAPVGEGQSTVGSRSGRAIRPGRLDVTVGFSIKGVGGKGEETNCAHVIFHRKNESTTKVDDNGPNIRGILLLVSRTSNDMGVVSIVRDMETSMNSLWKISFPLSFPFPLSLLFPLLSFRPFTLEKRL